MMEMVRGRVGRSMLALGLGLLAAAPVAAQTGASAPELRAAEAAMVEGDFAEARRLVEAWGERGSAGADRVSEQHGLWLRATLTVDPDGAELLYRRLVVEHPGGPWSDQALLRLARGAEARDEVDVAERYLQILVRDYPSSPHRVEARAQLARLGAPAARAERPADAAAPPPAQAETPAQAAPPARQAPPAEPRTAPTAAAAATDGSFTVQLGAFGTRDRAESFAAELRLAGMEVRVVQVEGSPLFRVRTGAFASREAAEARADELDARGFEAFVSADRDRERSAG